MIPDLLCQHCNWCPRALVKKNRTYDWVFSPQLIQEILPPPISSAGRSFTTWQTLTPLSLFANWLYVSAQREKYLLSFFTWTTKRNVCCDKTNKIEMDLHVGHPFTINTGIILLGFIYFLNKTWTFILEVRIHRTIIPFSLYSSLNLDTEVKNMAQK